MKKIFFLFVTLVLISSASAQKVKPQPQGEFHKAIVKKTDEERRKTKGKEWWGAGVIIFSRREIPRLGTTKEVEPIMQNEFNTGEKFVGRVFLPTHLSGLEGGMPDRLYYKMISDSKQIGTITESKGDKLPDAEWSSWMIDFPDDLKSGFESLPSGESKVRIEIWSSTQFDKVTIYKDKESGKTLGLAKEKDSGGKFIASGEFTFKK